MMDNKHLTDKAYEALEEKIDAMVSASVQFAEESPWPEEIEMYRDVYVQEDYPYLMD
jgi:pyruvate dehydrogenase E1 component alpha subunit